MLNQLPFMFISMPGPVELGIIFVVALLLFGAKRLPEIAKSLGNSIKEFKKSLSEEVSQDKVTFKEEKNN